MPTACINQPECRVHLKSERLEIRHRNDLTGHDELLRGIPLRDLDRLIIGETVQVSAQALATLLRSSIPVNILGWNGQFLGGFLPATNTHGLARLRQYQRIQDPAFTHPIASRIIAAKIYNQRRVLQRLGASRNEPTHPSHHETGAHPPTPAMTTAPSTSQSELAATLQWLDGLLTSLRQAATIDELRGYEGASTARYFHAWAGFLPAAHPFQRRSTRPPLNPVNACISFGATLLYSEAVACIHAHGLDPALGLLHATEDGRWSLALDLIEPFRPVFVEALALDLFSHQILRHEHFEHRDGGCYLDQDGRRKFFLQYERRMERQFMSESAGHRTTLRQQLEAQAILFKAALDDPSRFEPFLMN